MTILKMKYIYLFVICIIAVILITVSNETNTGSKNIKPEGTNIEIGNDTHQPTKDNVSQNVTRQLNILKKDVDEHPDDTLKIREYADFLAAAHKPDEAMIYYQKLLKVDPKRMDILFSVSFIYYEKKNIQDAEKITGKILSIDKNNLQAIYNLGALAATKGEINKAKEIWVKLIADHPNSPASNLAKESLQRL